MDKHLRKLSPTREATSQLKQLTVAGDAALVGFPWTVSLAIFRGRTGLTEEKNAVERRGQHRAALYKVGTGLILPLLMLCIAASSIQID